MSFSTLIWICWGLFGVVWIGGAIYNALNGPRMVRQGQGSRSWWLIGLVVLIIFRRFLPPAWTAFRFHLPWVQGVGAIVLVAATIFTLWARLVLGRMWSSDPMVKSDHRLRTDGPYRITRHPIYTGMLGMMVGSALITGPWVLPILLATLAMLLSKMQTEERMMRETFGEAYLEYQRRVPRLIPGWKGLSCRRKP